MIYYVYLIMYYFVYVYLLKFYIKLKLFLDPVVNVMLSSTNLTKSKKFWSEILNLNIFTETDNFIELGFGDEQAKLKLRDIGNF